MKDENLKAQLTTGRESTLSCRPQVEPTIQTQTVLLQRVLVLGNVDFDVSCTKQVRPVCVWPDAAEHANEVYNYSRRPVVPGQSDVVEPIVLERRAFSGQAGCDLLPREKPSWWPPWGCLAFAIKLEHPAVRRGSLDPIAVQGIFVGWNRRVPRHHNCDLRR